MTARHAAAVLEVVCACTAWLYTLHVPLEHYLDTVVMHMHARECVIYPIEPITDGMKVFCSTICWTSDCWVPLQGVVHQYHRMLTTSACTPDHVCAAHHCMHAEQADMWLKQRLTRQSGEAADSSTTARAESDTPDAFPPLTQVCYAHVLPHAHSTCAAYPICICSIVVSIHAAGKVSDQAS